MKQLAWIPILGMWLVARATILFALLGVLVGLVSFLSPDLHWWQSTIVVVGYALLFGTAVCALHGLRSLRESIGLD